MEELSKDPELTPGLVKLLSEKLADTRKALDEAKQEIQDLRDEMVVEGHVGSRVILTSCLDDVLRELERMRDDLADKNVQLEELSGENERMRNELDDLRTRNTDTPSNDEDEDIKPPVEDDIPELRQQTQELQGQLSQCDKELELQNRRDGAIRQRVQRTRSRSPAHKRRRSRSPSPEPQLILYKNGGAVPPAKVRPKASDYSKSIKELINRAVQKLTVKIYTIDAFPSDELNKEWSRECWISTCREMRKKFTPQEGIVRIVNAPASPDVEAPILNTVAYARNNALHEDIVAANMARVARLLSGTPKRFGYKDFDADKPEVYAEVPMLMHALQKRLFSNEHDIGAEFHAAFDPLPIPTIAFLLTCAECSLDSWVTGKPDQAHHFRTAEYRAKYRSHLQWLTEDWEALDPDAVEQVRHEMYEQVLRYGGITMDSTETRARNASNETRERMRRALAARKSAAQLTDR
ncbi:uncharacterized protein PHACADRAFT_180964 [Phanerochaete carnosa HHB-10118-sp]|uniref:DUF6532 domain-containing protein n=1 Tax=Phanerochaete carnosa (strain HHB-10118-sp) TaxID=650164 RepID=K5V821_PHACS|nr:uncharacterized protein PHACADRAFT_180964 [Phanerochaete carnosa HHB-10118-sp]EKM58916.1 hypothetical protein PHACADRAFT_180964 [Phanerochaete carnosa HHB-10118-sp]